MGEVKESIDAYQQAGKLDRKDFRSYYGACLAMAHQGEYQKAFDLLIIGERRERITKAIPGS
ncbi:MAG: hypothetical protein WDN75_10490 [Bacteroidota bacterium]